MKDSVLRKVYVQLTFWAVVVAFAAILLSTIHVRSSKILQYALLAPAAASIGLRLWLIRRDELSVDMGLLWLLAFAYMGSALLNRELVEVRANCPQVFLLVFYALVAYPLYRFGDREQRKRLLTGFFTAMLLGVLTLCALGLYAFFTDTIIEPPAEWLGTFLGLTGWGRLQLFCHPNSTGIYCYLGSIALLVLALMYKRVWVRVAAGVAFVALLGCLSVTDSRAAYLIFVGGVALCSAVIAWQGIRRNRKPAVRALCVLLAVVATVVAFFSYTAMFAVMNRLKTDMLASRATIEAAPAETAEVQTDEAAPTDQDVGLTGLDGMAYQRNEGHVTFDLSQRDQIWLDCFRYLREHPEGIWLGYSHGALGNIVNSMGYNHGVLHNTLMEVLLSGGVISLLLFAGFLARLVWVSLRVMFGRGDIPIYERLLPVFLLCTLVHCMAESLLPDVLHLTNLLFFVVAGAVERVGREQRAARG